MQGPQKGFLATVVTGTVLIAVVYVLLNNADSAFKITAGKPYSDSTGKHYPGGAVSSFQNFSVVAQGG